MDLLSNHQLSDQRSEKTKMYSDLLLYSPLAPCQKKGKTLRWCRHVATGTSDGMTPLMVLLK